MDTEEQARIDELLVDALEWLIADRDDPLARFNARLVLRNLAASRDGRGTAPHARGSRRSSEAGPPASSSSGSSSRAGKERRGAKYARDARVTFGARLPEEYASVAYRTVF
jgi:hypothetical protein